MRLTFAMLQGKRVAMALAAASIALWAVLNTSARAEHYDGPYGVGIPGATAALLDPNDPVPQIGQWPCRDHCEHHDGCGERCRDHREVRGDGPIVVDCSGRHRDMLPSLGWAVAHAPPNTTIFILPPGKGMTCVESVRIDRPLTIATYGGDTPAVIQAPDGSPCVDADIPLGDKVVFVGVTFIARGRDAPCVLVRAGHVVMRNANINSRNTNWAFDVMDSGELTIENTKIETGGSGVHAYRAHIHVHGLSVDMSPNRTGAALQLERTDGEVDGAEIVGGRWGIVASAGAHGLSLSNIKVARANIGVAIVAGGQGPVHADGLWLSHNRTGLLVSPFATADVSKSTISSSQDEGIVVYASEARITDNTIVGGRIGIRIARANEFNWTDVPLRPLDDPLEPSVPEFVSNHVGYIDEAAVFADDDAPARLIHNALFAPPHCDCIAGDRSRLNIDDNHCLRAPFDERPRESFDWHIGFSFGISAGIDGSVGADD